MVDEITSPAERYEQLGFGKPERIDRDKGEMYGIFRERGIRNVLIMGVHVNMCILNRPFAIKQLVRWGFQVALIREHLDPGSPSSLGIVFVDSETAEGTWGKTAEVTHAMLNELEKYVKTGLYSNLDFLENMDGAPWGYPLWLAHYSPTSGHAFTLWQFTNAGGCHGVVGAVDINLWPGTEEDLHHLFTHK